MCTDAESATSKSRVTAASRCASKVPEDDAQYHLEGGTSVQGLSTHTIGEFPDRPGKPRKDIAEFAKRAAQSSNGAFAALRNEPC